MTRTLMWLKHLPVIWVLAVSTSLAFAADRVVYHIDDASTQAIKALRNARNQLDVAPGTSITLVALGDGVDFLKEGAKDAKSNVEYAPLISDLKSRGVNFEVCEITLEKRDISKSDFVMEASFIRSGVVRITTLQSKQHYAYIKP